MTADGLRPTLPPFGPPGWAKLMQACWAADPHARPDCPTVLFALEQIAAALDPVLADRHALDTGAPASLSGAAKSTGTGADAAAAAAAAHEAPLLAPGADLLILRCAKAHPERAFVWPLARSKKLNFRAAPCLLQPHCAPNAVDSQMLLQCNS